MSNTAVIQCAEVYAAGLHPGLDKISAIEIDMQAYGKGRFGTVYEVLHIYGASLAVPLVVKIFDSDMPELAERGYVTTLALQKALETANNESMATDRISLLQRLPFFDGAPLLVFKGLLLGRVISGHIAQNLNFLNYQPYDTIMAEDMQQYLSKPPEARMELALQVASGVSLLQDLKFIHADIKDEAFFINLADNKCSIIDYDGGVLYQNSTSRPVTPGTMQSMLAPEIMQQLRNKKPEDVQVTFFSDMWSVSVAIHQILLGPAPLFFLSGVTDVYVDDYLKKFSWPLVDSSYENFNTDNEPFYQFYLQELGKFPIELLQLFKHTIHTGYFHPEKRISPHVWEETLRKFVAEPQILFFEPNASHFETKVPLEFTWQTAHARQVFFNGAEVVLSGKYELIPDADASYTLTAWNSAGQTSLTRYITVSKTAPSIAYFRQRPKTNGNGNKGLMWEVNGAEYVSIDQNIGPVPAKGELDLKFDDTGEYTLTATSSFGVAISKKITITSLYYQEPGHNIFYPEPAENIFYS